MKRSLRKYSLTLRHIGHTRTNNGFFKRVEALLCRLTHASFHKLSMHVAYRYQHVTISLHYLHAKMCAFNSLIQQNPGHRNIKWTFADLLPCLLRNKDKQQNNPIVTFATRLCRQRKWHEWTASSSLQNTITVNLPLEQCEFHTSKTLSLQELNQLIGIKMPTSGFSRNIWFLIPISRGKIPDLPPSTDAHAIIDYFISGFTN